MRPYDHLRIEKKWQRIWKSSNLYKTGAVKGKKCFVLDMFPYPSGDGLHVGHPKGYIATDVYSRMKKMQGHSVLHPMGWDAFGLPAENYAIQNKIHPKKAVSRNIKRFKKQLEILGFNYDWSREINTTDPKYYKWTQWIFLQMFKRGLVYLSNEPINWCPSCKTGLANEDLEEGKCERCGSEIEKRPFPQWVLKITDYADRLLADLEGLNWPDSIKEQQVNWIGRSEGVEIDFPVKNSDLKIKIFTTRPETVFGVTFVALSPEHPFAKKSNGMIAINPANKDEVRVVVADYVLSDYGFGAVMGVPAHDERDAEFAKANNIPFKSADFADKAIIEKIGRKTIKYKLRDWVFSRQRYWGEPIPLVHCARCGVVPVPEKNLPVKLPDVESYEPTGTGESPLASIMSFVNTKCPKCLGPAKRETNTMPQWAGSCWYYLAYIMRGISDLEFQVSKYKKSFQKWLPVDMYVGGAEHATRHLIYARFWHKFLYDIGAVEVNEPFENLRNVGLILASDGRKMSKRYGNVINPDDIVKKFGADSLRVYEMFMGPFNQAISWNTDSLVGGRRFLEKILRLKEKAVAKHDNPKIDILLNQTIKKVTEDILSFRFNTAISSLMILTNELEVEKCVSLKDFYILLKLLSPFAPHLTEEIWSSFGQKNSIHGEKWPSFNPNQIIAREAVIVVQVNGKTRGSFLIERDAPEKFVEEKAMRSNFVATHISGKQIKRIVVVKNRLINFVTT